ncbi:hypothetical protein ScPMuIL_003188 [Solemya velum]
MLWPASLGLETYRIAVVMENGYEGAFDLPLAGPAVQLGMADLKNMMAGVINIEYEQRFLANTPNVCERVHMGTLLAELYYEKNIQALIGPGCSLSVEIAGLMAASWQLPMITPVGAGVMMADKDMYRTLTRLSPDYRAYARFFVNVLNSFNWTDVVFIGDRGNVVFDLQEDTFLPIFKNAGITGKSLRFGKAHECEDVLREASRSARVFIISVFPEILHNLLTTAQGLGMTDGDYALLVIRQVFHRGKEDQLYPFKYHTEQDYIKAYDAVLVVDERVPMTPVYEQFVSNMVRMSLEQYNYDYKNASTSRYILEYYNAFILMGHALNQTINDGGDLFDGMDVLGHMWNTSFEGLGSVVTLDSNGDRDDDFTLVDFKTDGASEVSEVATYFGVTRQYQFVPGTNIQWPGNKGPPPNTPYCGFLGDAARCRLSEFPVVGIIAIVFGALFAVMVIVGILFYRKTKFESDLQNLWWKVGWDEVVVEAVSLISSHSRISFLQSDTDGKSIRKQNDFSLAVYRGTAVVIEKLRIKRLTTSRDMLMQLKELRDVNCPNLAKFVGICPDEPNISILMEHCSRGSLLDILQNESIRLDKHFKVSLLNDVLEGMTYIHNCPLVCHGRLNSSNCVIDSRFVLKITDYGLMTVRSQEALHTDSRIDRVLLWVAPEHLRTNPYTDVSQPGDVYSFAIVFYELVTRTIPYEDKDDMKDVLTKVKNSTLPPMRPTLDMADIETPIANIIKQCWQEDFASRPNFRRIQQKLKSANWVASQKNFFDTLLQRMEQYANNLEGLVGERTTAFLEEKRKAEALLYHILPKSVADVLKNGESVGPESYDSVTVYFSDIVGFTSLASESTPIEVVDLLNDLYTCFDDIIDLHDAYKVETIGDAYMVVSGLPTRNGTEHAREAARLSLAILRNIGSFRIRHRKELTLRARIGLHSGPVCAGVVGRKMPRYCLFGDTVNTASRMESNGEAMKIHISPSTKTLLDMFGSFQTVRRGNIEIKGKGIMTTYWLLRELTEERSANET